MVRALLSLLILTSVSTAWGQVKHELLRRVAVFPIAEESINNAEEAWWKMREQLTKDQRFLVASRRFMINRGVFQPRKDFKTADAIILAKILDAQALVVSAVQDRTLLMKVYDGENGYILWTGSIDFHPALSMNDQIISVAQKLVQDFMNAMPYQGFVVIDPLRPGAIFEEGGKKKAWVYTGLTKTIDVGDAVEVIEFNGETSKPYFQNGKTTVVAQGEVGEVQSDRALVILDKMRQMEDIHENALVRFPKEVKRLTELYTQGKDTGLAPEYLSAEMRPAETIDRRHTSTSTSLAFIINMAAMILLAF